MPALRIEVFGGFAVRPDGGEARPLPAKKARALLAFLALPAGRAHSRERLTALLWGDTPDALARQAFRQTLSRLRRALGDSAGALIVDGAGTVALDAARVWVDAGEFETAVTRQEPAGLERAAELYRGDLLEGLDVGEPAFEEWFIVERERLRELALDALAKLLRHQMDVEATDAAVQTALRILALDALQEVVHRALMRLYLTQGRRAAALRQYQECIQLLEREIGAEPEELTRELYRTILRGAEDAQPARPSAVRSLGHQPSGGARGLYIGRAAALGALERSLEAALDAGGRATLISGEAGSGKTRLLEEFTAAVSARGIRIARGRCYETEQPLPFRPWLDTLRADGVALAPELRDAMSEPTRASLVRLFPELGRPDERPAITADEHGVLFAALSELVRQLARDAPLVIALDDLHWADAMSARLLAFLARRLGSLPVLIIGSVRSEEIQSPVLETALGELRTIGLLDDIALGALTRDESLDLARALSALGRPRVVIDAIADDLWTLSEGNPFVIVETMRALSENAGGSGRRPALPQSVRQSVSARVARLTEGARRTVAAAAVVGRACSFRLLSESTGLGETAAAAAAEELVRRRVLETLGDSLVIAHDRIRQAVYDDLVPAVRMALHGAVARALESVHTADADEVANELGHHFLVAGDTAKAIGYLERFADVAARRYALDAALDARRQAIEAAEALAPSARDRTLLEVAFRQGFVFSLSGRHGDALELMQRYAPLLERVGDPALASDYYFRLAVASQYFGRYVDGRQAAEAAMREAERARDDQRFGRGALALAMMNLGLGQISEALAHATRAASLLDTPASRHWLGMAYWLLVWSHTVHGRLDAALETGATFRALAITLGDRRLQTFAAYITALVHIAHGDSVTALEYGREATEMAADPIAAGLARLALGLAHLEHGDFKRAIDVFDEVLALRPASVTRLRALAHQAEAYVGVDDLTAATRAAHDALDGATRDATPFLVGLAERVLGRIARARRDHAAAVEHLARGLDSFLSGEAELEAALTRLELARVVAEQGDAGAARAHLADAARVFAKAGASRRSAQSDEVARSLGL